MAILKIREKQMAALRLEGLVNLCEASIRKHFPSVVERMDRRAIDPFLRRSIHSAWDHDFTSTGDVLQYVQLSAALGERFEEREDLPWARSILAERRPDQRGFRAVRLYENALRHLRAKERAAVGRQRRTEA